MLLFVFHFYFLLFNFNPLESKVFFRLSILNVKVFSIQT